MTITTLSIDLAKHVFHVLGADRRGQIVLRKKLTRSWPLQAGAAFSEKPSSAAVKSLVSSR